MVVSLSTSNQNTAVIFFWFFIQTVRSNDVCRIESIACNVCGVGFAREGNVVSQLFHFPPPVQYVQKEAWGRGEPCRFSFFDVCPTTGSTDHTALRCVPIPRPSYIAHTFTNTNTTMPSTPLPPPCRLQNMMPSADDDVNIACFHPEPGMGCAYGTKQGRVCMVRMGH